MPAFFKHVFGNDIHISQRLRLAVTGIAILGMIGVTLMESASYNNRPPQVGALSGKNVSMDKLADVFMGMDEIALERHFHRIWTYNGIIFLGALLLVTSLKDAGKK